MARIAKFHFILSDHRRVGYSLKRRGDIYRVQFKAYSTTSWFFVGKRPVEEYRCSLFVSGCVSNPV
jgi:hypothetical protein